MKAPDGEVKLENARAELNLVQRKAHDLEKKQEQARRHGVNGTVGWIAV